VTTSPSNTISKPASTTQLLTTISASPSSLSSSSAQSNITTLPTGSMMHNETLTSGAKAGIAIGVILGGVIVYMVAILCLKREIRREAALTLIEKHKLALIPVHFPGVVTNTVELFTWFKKFYDQKQIV